MLDHKKSKIRQSHDVFGKPKVLITNNPKIFSSDTIEETDQVAEIMQMSDPDIFYNPTTNHLKEKLTEDQWFAPDHGRVQGHPRTHHRAGLPDAFRPGPLRQAVCQRRLGKRWGHPKGAESVDATP